jgi:5-methylcytosine-specific restriction endonuclease McrA
MPYKDPADQRANARLWYAKNSKKHILKVKQRKVQLRTQLNAWKRTLACGQCGENYPDCLEFHHPDPKTKEGEPSAMYASKGWTIARIKEYLTTHCVVLCANCHRKVHAEERAQRAKQSAGRRRKYKKR